MITFIIFIVAIFFILMYLGFKYQSYVLLVLTSFGMITFGVYISYQGVERLNNLLTTTLGIIFICFASYILLRSTLEQATEAF